MIQFQNLSKVFENSFVALDNISFDIQTGDIFGIIGQSGAGKSTLLRCINLLERPTSGRVVVDGEDLCQLSHKQLLKKRSDIGMIFQNFSLFQQRSVLQNVEMPLIIQGCSAQDACGRALELLELVGLKDKANVYPSQLSGGQAQRVAIARALACNPSILLCDEPTSALDPETTDSILQLLKMVSDKLGVTIVIITHSLEVASAICNRVCVLKKGRVQEVGPADEVLSSYTNKTLSTVSL